jgi:hypothetical protein
MKLRIKTPADLETARIAVQRDAMREDARAFLAATDWLIVRRAETGTEVPPNIVQARAKARHVLSGGPDKPDG